MELPAGLISPTPSTGSSSSNSSSASESSKLSDTPTKDATNVDVNAEEAPTECVLDVECGPNKGVLYLSKLCQGSKGSCILFNGSWLTPNEFQYVSGRETAKDWKRSIRHFGKSMKLLLTKSIMTVQPPVCKCETCRPDLIVTEAGKEDSNSSSPTLLTVSVKTKTPTTPDNRKNGVAKKVKVKTLAKMADPTAEKPPGVAHDNNNSEAVKDSELHTDSNQTDDKAMDDANNPPRESRLNNIIEGLKKAKPQDGTTVNGDIPITNGHMDNTSQNGISDTSDNEVRSGDVRAASAATAVASSSSQPAAAAMITAASMSNGLDSSSDQGHVSPHQTSTDDAALAPGILRNMLKIPMDGKVETKEGNISSHSPNTNHTPQSHSPPLHNNMERTPPRTKSPEKPKLPEPKLWSPHDGLHGHYPVESKHPSEKKPNEMNGHYVIDHKPYMTSSMTPPALKPITKKEHEKSPKKPDHINGDDRSKKDGVFRMPETDTTQPKVYAPVTWPPVAPEPPNSKKEEIRRPPPVTSAEKTKTSDVSKMSSVSSSHKSSSSSLSSSSSSSEKSSHSKTSAATVTTTSAVTTLSQEALAAQYHDYLRQPGLYPGLASPRMDSAEYLAFLRKYYEWYELQQRIYASYPMSAAGSGNPYASFMPGMLDPRLRQDVPKQTPHMTPYIYGIDPRALPGAVPVDWSKCGLARADLKPQTPGPSTVESPNKASASHSSPHHLSPKPEVNGKRSHAESEAEALDLSVKRRRMEESRAAAEKESMQRDMLSAFGRVNPLSNSLHAAAAGAQGMPMGYPMYPGMWELAALQPGAIPGVSIPGLTPGSPYSVPQMSKDHVDPVVTTHIPFTLPHLTPPCTSLADRERLMAHFRL